MLGKSKPIEAGACFNGRIVIRELPPRPAAKGKTRRVLLCRCEKCNHESEVLYQNRIHGCPRCRYDAMRGKTVFANYLHGMHDSPTHQSWRAMRRRCNAPQDAAYANYGGRGIRVCDRWATFKNFLADMGLRPNEAHSIERINNDGDYEPGNCKWATDTEQAHNKRNNRLLTVNGITQPITVWARTSPVTSGAILFRLRHGWSPEDAVLLPAGVRGNGRIKPGQNVCPQST